MPEARWKNLLSGLGFGQFRCARCLELVDHQAAERQPAHRLCPDCNARLAPHPGARCSVCGNPTHPAQLDHNVCPACQKTSYPWRQCAWYGLYEGDLRDSILKFKFGGRLSYTSFLVDLLLYASRCLPAPDAVVPIPQAMPGLRKRGFNQAHELGKALCRISGLTFAPSLLKRAKAGPKQEQLNARERRKNMKGAFSSNKSLSGQKIWLLDDVMTTGSTFEAAAQTLKAAGAGDIYLLCLARTALN